MTDRVAELRRAFDATFAAAPARRSDADTVLLLATVGGERRALRLSDFVAIERSTTFVPLRGELPGLVGMAGHRDRLLAVYDLATMLGLPPSDGGGLLGVSRRDETIALRFAGLDGQVRVRQDEAAAAVVGAAGATVPVVDVGALVGEIVMRAKGG